MQIPLQRHSCESRNPAYLDTEIEKEAGFLLSQE